MNSFVDLEAILSGQPLHIGVLLSRTDVGKGREGLFTDQLPELLAGLARNSRVESIRASTAIEGFEVEADRAAGLAASPPVRVRNRSEKEFAGYRDAIDGLLRSDSPERPSIPFILSLHRTLYAHSGGRGGHLKSEDDQIVRYGESGRELLFETVSFEQTPFMLGELVERYEACLENEEAHPLILLGLMALDFLAIHPVADGNERLARLLTTHELLRAGYGVARYVSVEQRILETKETYYAGLHTSQRGWHAGRHDPWPWLEYFVGVLADCYAIFEARVAAARSTEGLGKQEIVRRHVLSLTPGSRFRLRDIRRALPGISDPTIRLALRALRNEGQVAPNGRGREADSTRL